MNERIQAINSHLYKEIKKHVIIFRFVLFCLWPVAMIKFSVNKRSQKVETQYFGKLPQL